MYASNPPPSRVALALTVRKQLVAQASEALQGLIDVVQERLFASMDEAAPSREKQLRRDTWMAFQKNKSLWHEGVLKAWDSLLTALPASKKTTLELSGAFELVGMEVVENKIVASRLALGLMESAATEVNDLRTRLKSAAGGRELNPSDIVHPETLFLPLIEQWAQCGLSPEAWPLINEVVRGQLFDPLKAAYAICNAMLVEQGVLPVIEFGANSGHSGFIQQDYGDPGSALPAGAQGQPMPMGRSGPMTQPGQFRQPGQVFGRPTGYGPMGGVIPQGVPSMPAQLSGGYPGQMMGGGAPGGAYGGGAPGAYWQGARAQGLIDQISRLLVGAVQPGGTGWQPGMGAGMGYPGAAAGLPQGGGFPGNVAYPGGGQAVGGAMFGGAPMVGGAAGMYGYGAPMAGPGDGQIGGAPGGVDAGGGAGAFSGGGVHLMTAIAQQPMLADVYYSQPGAVLQGAAPMVVQRVATQLREQSDEIKSKATTEGEKAIVELVALMFQAILEEDRIPSGIRVWFARLQMPVLRVALGEPEFFTKLDHPARQLIDHMGSCVLGFDSSGLSSAALEVEVKRIVQVIEQYPETGARVYQRVYEEFQMFLKKHLTQKPVTQKVVAVAEQVEQMETLAIQYTIELRNLIKDMPVRDEIREFLYKIWTEALAISAVRQGPQHEETLLLKKGAADLIWAASAKPNRADRAKVISNLPDLLQCLRTGLKLINTQPDDIEAHIKSISAVLVEAFMSKTKAIASEEILALGERLANLEDYITDGGAEELPLNSQTIEELLGVDASALDVITQGGGAATPVMMEWVRGLDIGAWFTLKYNNQVSSVQYVWRSPQGYLHLFASNVGRSYLIQSVRVAGYLQGGLLEPQEMEPLTMRATRDAMSKLEADPTRLLTIN